ncbi:haloalkane dehalogenase [Kribbella italica]|uniref:Haloalkane dehalogenase n=1 Tax=Kribbella italica TaxID=1540520 RepID=A0A7W9JC15_9ACTN|nr:haloalkane dehalogenase [Kribbella italica]MBB5839184.1 haloalkane dehalogenase [Kribbella italica]
MQFTEVHGVRMAWREVGSGPPVVFLHGNPTSSYLWRNVLDRVAQHGRCIAPDLVGMGASGKLPDSGPGRYRLVEHREYLDALLSALGVEKDVVFIGHDWGSVLGIDWCRRHPDAVRGIAYLETLAAPVAADSENAPDPELFGPLRGPAGETLVLDDNFFVEKVLPAGIQRTLAPDEMAAYRTPYEQPGESRRPTLTWAREIPMDGDPADVAEIVARNAEWMATSPIPKLFVNGDPGALLTGPLRTLCRQWPNQHEVTVPGLHFLPEDSPHQLATALNHWLTTLTPA